MRRLLALLLLRAAGAWKLNLTRVLRAERARAEDLWRRGRGLLWFQHFRRAGGTTLCHLVRDALPNAKFLLARGETCQPEDWKLRDAAAVCEHNLTLLARELIVQEGNAFAQEYGAVPGLQLMGHRVQRHRLGDWVFIANIRDPWSRFWSQLRYEMATCLIDANALTRCIGGNFDSLGHWWSPTAHPDTVLGVPTARTWHSPEIYVDNYYTRVLLNRTDFPLRRLTEKDGRLALQLLEHRMSAVIVVEDFPRSSLQLACTLGLDLAKARMRLGVRIRPYEAHETLFEVPPDDKRLGAKNMKALKSRFMQKNKYDYALYHQAKKLSNLRSRQCAKQMPEVKELWLSPPQAPAVSAQPLAKDGEALPPPLSVDDLFGCSGGEVKLNEETGQWMILCPRSAIQHANSWWSSETGDAPKRKLGQKAAGADCWHAGFTWETCCTTRKFGAKGNRDCWDEHFTHSRCCRES